jgi:hypothetical protein
MRAYVVIDAYIELVACIPKLNNHAILRCTSVSFGLLGGLGGQLHDDCRDRRRDASNLLAGRHRPASNMTVDPLQGIGGRKPQRLRLNDPSEPAPTTLTCASRHFCFGAVPMGIYRLSLLCQPAFWPQP